MNDKDLSLLRRAYSDIIKGYTKAIYKDSPVVIKHFTNCDQGTIDLEFDIFYQKALSQGLPNEEQRLKTLIEQEIWTNKDQFLLETYKKVINNLVQTKAALSFKSQMDKAQQDIDEATLKLTNKEAEKKELMGLTADSYASRKLNERYIYYAFRKFPDGEDFFFTEEEFTDLTVDELNELAILYNKYLEPFKLDNLKKIGLAQFFQNIYSICEDNPYTFYGKAICNLTYYQTEIFSYGRFFRSILTSSVKPPDDVAEDADKLMDWHLSRRNAQDLVGKVDSSTTGATHLFGVKKSDIAVAGGTVAESPVERGIREKKKGFRMDEVMAQNNIN